MEFIKYDFLTEKAHYRDKDATEIKKLSLLKAPEEVIVHIICQELEAGKFLSEICTGEDWKPTLRGFHSLLDTNIQYKSMYIVAVKALAEIKKKEIFDINPNTADKAVIKEFREIHKILLAEIENLKKELKEDAVSQASSITFELNSPYENEQHDA